MKKLIVTALFLLVANLGMAQAQAFKDDVQKLLRLSGASSQVDVAKKQIITMIPAAKQEAFLKDFNASLTPLFEAQEKFYMAEFTHDDVKKMITFYETPVGKKMAEKSSKLTEATMPVIQQWSMSLQEIIMKYQ
ncbi:MAG: DUF2059 domain-containing protein [Flavobacterium sp.]|nr:MAG: DUF2059 domain-containing protein [Flavobacterium sp.]